MALKIELSTTAWREVRERDRVGSGESIRRPLGYTREKMMRVQTTRSGEWRGRNDSENILEVVDHDAITEEKMQRWGMFLDTDDD